MITTLTGENSFAWQQVLSSLVKEFTEEQGELAVERIDGEEASLERVREALINMPFLASRKLVVLRSPSANKQFTEQAEHLLADVPESTDVVLVEPKIDKRGSYFKLLKQKTDFKEFTEQDANGLAGWLVKEAQNKKGKLGLADARYLVDLVGPNQQMLASELEKLLIYNADINRKTIDLLVEPTPQSTIFQLLEAAFSGKTKRAFELYKEQRAMKVEPQQIIALMAWQLQLLALIKTAGDRSADTIAKEAKLSPYAVKRSQTLARELTLSKVQALVSRLLSIDERSKTQTFDIDQALQNYLLELA